MNKLKNNSVSVKATFDYILVGQGLAGSCLALQLLQRGKKILVIDRAYEHTATRVAAGLFNPITGKKMMKTWLADTLFPYLHEFYKNAEQLTKQKFFYSMPLYRPFISVEEQNEWMGKSEEKGFSDYIEVVHTTPTQTECVKNEFGGLKLKQCGYLNTIEFTKAVRAYIMLHGALLEEDFVEEDLTLEHEGVRYRGNTARSIIFCQGEAVHSGKLFSWLPIRPLKGETLTIETELKDNSTIYNRGVYVVPDIWKVGATYQFQDTTRAVTQEALQELTSKLNELVSFPYRIIRQSWGMRPTTPDRRPILGPHPDHPAVVIFNGLGTKGVSLAPYFSKVLTEWLENGTPVNKEVDINRYKHYNYAGNFLR